MVKEARFFLDNPASPTPTPLLLAYTCQDKVMKYSTGYKLLKGEWNVLDKIAPGKSKVNRRVSQLKTWVDEFTNDGKKPVLAKDLKTFLLIKDGKEEKTIEPEIPVKNEPTVASVFKIYIDLAKNKKITTTKNVFYSPNTIKNWEKIRDKLKAFRPTLRFSDINLITYNEFKLWCNAQGFALNYFGDLVKSWKALMNLSYGEYHQNLIHKDPKFARLEEIIDKVYLNDDEIKKLIQLTLTGKQEIIRDRFVLNLFTGLRISDMQTLHTDNIHADKITDVATKNGKSVAIPLFKELKAILKKYNGELPPKYHQNHINTEIKEICKEAGMTEIIEYKETRGGIVKHVKKPKYKLITNHTCRRSLATNLLKKTTETKAMKVLGMSLKTIQRYNRISAADNANEVLKDIERGAFVGDYGDVTDWAGDE